MACGWMTSTTKGVLLVRKNNECDLEFLVGLVHVNNALRKTLKLSHKELEPAYIDKVYYDCWTESEKTSGSCISSARQYRYIGFCFTYLFRVEDTYKRALKRLRNETNYTD